MKRVYVVRIPLADGQTAFDIARCQSPEAAAEIVRALLAYSSLPSLMVVVETESTFIHG